jgi:hypothetical protein
MNTPKSQKPMLTAAIRRWAEAQAGHTLRGSPGGQLGQLTDLTDLTDLFAPGEFTKILSLVNNLPEQPDDSDEFDPAPII